VPTHRENDTFWRDWDRLTADQQDAFLDAVATLVSDLRQGAFRKGLRVKRVQKLEGVWEMTWAPDGRATFDYGPSVRPGEHHIIWRRIGGHEILEHP
jgi:hypothetical protein